MQCESNANTQRETNGLRGRSANEVEVGSADDAKRRDGVGVLARVKMGGKGKRSYRYRDCPTPVQEKRSGRDGKKRFPEGRQEGWKAERRCYRFTWAMATELVHAGVELAA